MKIKLVVWDLDNTLWDGTVFYQDRDSVKLKPGTKATLKELNKRGIDCSICSKNNYDDAEKILAKFDILKYFTSPQIGWGSKSDSIKELAKLFNVRPEEVLFVDDDGFQRAEVAAQVEGMTEGVNIIELSDPIDVLDLPGIVPENATDADKGRVELLKQQRDREQAEDAFHGDYKDFLRTCGLNLTIRNMDDADWPRVTQLLNRTNELNAACNRYTMEGLKASFSPKTKKIFVAELKDKFGDYGLIAETIIDVKDDEWFINDLTVSCRTMGRGIGSALLTCVLKAAKEKGIKKVMGCIVENETNWRMKKIYEKQGFTLHSEQGERKFFELNLVKQECPEYAEWMNVKNDYKDHLEIFCNK